MDDDDPLESARRAYELLTAARQEIKVLIALLVDAGVEQEREECIAAAEALLRGDDG